MTALTTEETMAAALLLERDTWRGLFGHLLDDIDLPPDPVVEAAWIEECERRLTEMREGRVQGIPGHVVLARIRRLARKPPPPRPNVHLGGRELTASEVVKACLEMRVEDRLELCGRYLAQTRGSEAVRRETIWFEDSERWLGHARDEVAKRGS